MQTKTYRFRERKSGKKRPIEVMFRHIPGKWISTGKYTMAEAVLFAEAYIKEEGLAPRQKCDMTLREFANGIFSPADPQGVRRLNAKRNKQFSEQYYRSRQGLLDNWILPAHGDKLLTSITDTMIEDFALDIPRSDSLRNRVILTYRIILREACRQHIIPLNPADNVPLVTEINVHRSAFSMEEMAVLFPDTELERVRVWGSLIWAAYFSVLAETGFRPGEAAAVRKNNFFPEHKGIFITESVDASSGKVVNRIKTTGKGQGYKIGKLSSLTCALLTKLSAITMPGQLFFQVPSKQGEPRTIIPKMANRHLRGVAKRLGIEIENRTQYCFRHTFDTNLFGQIPEDVRLRLMGHRQDRPEYLHMTPEQGFRILDQYDVDKAILK